MAASRYSKSVFKTYYIYFHKKKDNDEVFYIGQGTHAVSGKEYYSRAYTLHLGNKFWLNTVNKHRYTVEIVLENLTFEQVNYTERYFIRLYGRKDLGLGLLVNLNDGGKEQGNLSQETRAILSEQKKGDKNPAKRPDVKAKIKLSKQKRYGIPPFYYSCPNPNLNPKCKKTLIFNKVALYNKAKKEQKVCNSCAYLGRIPWNKGLTRETDERVNKVATLKEGKTHSEETKMKISLNNKSRELSVRKKMSKSLKGRVPWNKGKSCSSKLQCYVLQIDPQNNVILQEFSSVKEALLSFGIFKNTSQIANAIRFNKPFKGYLWEYKKGGNCV